MQSTNRNISREAWPADFMVRIRNYQERIMAGELELVHSSEAISFQGLASLLAIMLERLDQYGYPQASMALRAWDCLGINENQEIPVSCSPLPSSPFAGPALASFMVRVQFRQNASWQGSIAWLEAGRSMTFRSVLELAGLMEQAIHHTAAPALTVPTTTPDHKWNTRESVS